MLHALSHHAENGLGAVGDGDCGPDTGNSQPVSCPKPVSRHSQTPLLFTVVASAPLCAANAANLRSFAAGWLAGSTPPAEYLRYETTAIHAFGSAHDRGGAGAAAAAGRR